MFVPSFIGSMSILNEISGVLYSIWRTATPAYFFRRYTIAAESGSNSVFRCMDIISEEHRSNSVFNLLEYYIRR